MAFNRRNLLGIIREGCIGSDGKRRNTIGRPLIGIGGERNRGRVFTLLQAKQDVFSRGERFPNSTFTIQIT